MAESNEVNRLSALLERRACCLVKSLAALRVAEKADVIMVCGEKEFYAHKVVLEASSSYFATMFQSNLEEAKSGKVMFKDMEPETLEVILDFLYLVDVKIISTDEELMMNVLEASHMMGLHDLFHYCSTSLMETLSPQNFLAMWTLAEKYETQKMLVDVKSYFLSNSADILSSKDFLAASVSQLKDLVVFFKTEVRNIDRMVKGIVLWVLHDVSAREQFTDELFTYIDANRVSKKCVKSLLANGELKTTSKELANRLKDLVIETCFVEENEFTEEAENDPTEIETNLKIQGNKLFVLQQKNTTKANSVGVNSFTNRIQLFDLGTMTWQPKKRLSCVNFKVDAICQYGDSIFLVGSTAGSLYVLYDPRKNTLQYVKSIGNLSQPNASACYFKQFIYLIGETANNGTASHVSVCLNLTDNVWDKTSSLNHTWSKPVLFTSDQHMFVTGGISSLSKQFVEYTTGETQWKKDAAGEYFAEMGWTVAELPQDFINAEVHFFSYSNQLCGMYNSDGDFVKLMHKDGNWHVEESPKNPLHRQLKLRGISHVQTKEKAVVLVSTSGRIHGIPNYILELESFEWTKLPEPRGECEINDSEDVLTTTCYLP